MSDGMTTNNWVEVWSATVLSLTAIFTAFVWLIGRIDTLRRDTNAMLDKHTDYRHKQNSEFQSHIGRVDDALGDRIKVLEQRAMGVKV